MKSISFGRTSFERQLTIRKFAKLTDVDNSTYLIRNDSKSANEQKTRNIDTCDLENPHRCGGHTVNKYRSLSENCAT